ncbi:MAG: UDP-N-acetylmuramoyl-L-alanine--D-glutamate ligase [Planctomycetota bacterium]
MTRVVVMGLGRFGGGASAARWFAQQGADVVATDLADEAKLGETIAALAELPITYRLGRHDEEDFARADVVVVNPAVPFDHPLVAHARSHGARVVTELGLTLQQLPGPVLAITGTNGKSTTATLAAAMLEASGRTVELGGNIGRSLLHACAGMRPDTVAVLEISSFQLAWLEHDGLAPQVGIVTNVTGDHLDRHPTMEHYVAAKRKLARAVPAGGLLLLPRHDPVASTFADGAAARVAWFDEEEPADLTGLLSGLRLAGRHNRANAAAAAYAALELGATPEGCAAGAAACEPLPHRLERVAELRGVLCVNDSVCTTPVAAAAAVRSFTQPVVLLTGGRDKGLDRGPLLEAARTAKKVVAYGETGPEIARLVPGALQADNLEEAFRMGLVQAASGDVFLLSPGFSSYDQFPGFDVRGRRFRELIEAEIAEDRPATR